MKKCPFCAEEIQDEAIVCKHCGRELVPLKPTAASAQHVTQTPASMPLNHEISSAMQRYSAAGYQVTSASGDIAVMDRPAKEIACGVASLLFFLTGGIGLLIYLAIFYIWSIRKAYHVQLSIGPDGKVVEIGNTLEEFERDRLQAGQKRHYYFGLVLSVLAIIWVLLIVLVLIAGPSEDTTWASHIGMSLMMLFLFGGPVGGLGAFLLLRAKKKKGELERVAIPA